MGDVMKESAQIALTYVRSVASDYGVRENYFEKHDIHLHIPEGAVSRMVKSAGIHDGNGDAVGVTGRKVPAACGDDRRGHAARSCADDQRSERKTASQPAWRRWKRVPVPANQPDVEELSKEIPKGMEIVYIKGDERSHPRKAFVPEK